MSTTPSADSMTTGFSAIISSPSWLINSFAPVTTVTVCQLPVLGKPAAASATWNVLRSVEEEPAGKVPNWTRTQKPRYSVRASKPAASARVTKSVTVAGLPVQMTCNQSRVRTSAAACSEPVTPPPVPLKSTMSVTLSRTVHAPSAPRVTDVAVGSTPIRM